MNFPTFRELMESHCTVKRLKTDHLITGSARRVYSDLHGMENPHFEQFSVRRYNYAAGSDSNSVRLVFLKDVLENSSNKTLRRHGRFIWCKNLNYEGRGPDGFRHISFTVDDGKKRFKVSENNALCIPSKIYINNNKYFKNSQNTFVNFSTVFGYDNSVKMLAKQQGLDNGDFRELLIKDNPFKPGTLVSPRTGYFYPDPDAISDVLADHPPGIILGPSFKPNHRDYVGREFYRVRFGDHTYEKVHPVQMEIINEV